MHHVTDFRIYHTTLTVNLTLWDTVVNCQCYKVDSKAYSRLVSGSAQTVWLALALREGCVGCQRALWSALPQVQAGTAFSAETCREVVQEHFQHHWSSSWESPCGWSCLHYRWVSTKGLELAAGLYCSWLWPHLCTSYLLGIQLLDTGGFTSLKPWMYSGIAQGKKKASEKQILNWVWVLETIIQGKKIQHPCSCPAT